MTVSKNVTIAAAGELSVVFNCEGNNNFITVDSEKMVILKDIVISHGKADLGGAVYVKNDADLILLNVDFLANSANDKGGAIYGEASSDIYSKLSTFEDNTALTRGGAVYTEGKFWAENSTFDGNDITKRDANVGNGGAAIYNNGGDLTVMDCSFTNNLLNYVPRGQDGATGDLIDGIIVSNGDTEITGSEFINNSGCYGGAITLNGVPADSSVIIDDCTFVNNTAYDGAGIYMYNVAGEYSIANSLFENNNATGTGSTGYVSAGGAVTIISCPGEGNITGSTFTNNSAASDGGAISVEDTNLLVYDCKFYNNSATNGAGIHFTGTPDASYTLTLTKSVFIGQSAKKGYSSGGSGAVEIYKNNAVITDCVFRLRQYILYFHLNSGTISNCLWMFHTVVTMLHA